MPFVISIIGVKGGVGKSSLARALAVIAAHGDLQVRLADLDHKQQASVRWGRERATKGRRPPIDVQVYETMADAVAGSSVFDVLVVDTPGSVSAATLDIALSSHVVVCPTGASADDLHPTIVLLHELVGAGVSFDRMTVALCRVLDAQEERDARAYVEHAGFDLLPGSIPERKAYRAAQNHGGSLAETSSDALNVRADMLMEALIAKIMKTITNSSTTKSKKGKRT